MYLSWAVAPFTDAQLQDLLTLARRRNAELAITGILFYGNERFLQIIEGEEEEVRALYELIRRDPRHEHITAYADKPIAQRAFAEWAMVFESSNPQQAAELAGYLKLADVALTIASLPPVDRAVFDLLHPFALP